MMIGIKVPPYNVTETAPQIAQPKPMSREEVKVALQHASVDIARGRWLTVRELTMRTAGLFPGAGLRFDELENLWCEIANERLAGTALDVAEYVPPPPPPPPPNPVEPREPVDGGLEVGDVG